MTDTMSGEQATVDDRTAWRLRPRFAGANIRTWIGFKQFMSLAEEAVLSWFRERGLGPQEVYHRYGLGLTVVDSSVQLPAVLEVDDEVEARVGWLGPGRFGVRLVVARDAAEITVLRGTVRVALVREHAAGADPPDCLSPLVVTGVGDAAGRMRPPPQASFRWRWQARYFHCHFSDRVQHGSYVQALEEVVDRFLADRGLAIPRLLADRGWIPVVSRARVRLLDDARMAEPIETTFAVTDIVKDRAFDGRMDSYATTGGQLRHVATGSILHGYAVSAGPFAGSLAELDDRTVRALCGATP